MINIGNGAIADSGEAAYDSTVRLSSRFDALTSATVSMLSFAGVAGEFRMVCSSSVQWIVGRMLWLRMRIATTVRMAFSTTARNSRALSITTGVVTAFQTVIKWIVRVNIASAAISTFSTARGASSTTHITCASTVATSAISASNAGAFALHADAVVSAQSSSDVVPPLEWGAGTAHVFTKRIAQ